MSGLRFLRNPAATGGTPWAPVLLLFAAVALSAGLCTPGTSAWAAEDKKEKPKKPAAKAKPLTVEQLAGLNGVALFGVPVKINKGRFTLIYPGTGEFDKGFTSKGRGRGGVLGKISDVKSAVFRKNLIDGHTKGKATLVGMLAGSTLSNFELVDDYKISFRMRIPQLTGRSRFAFLLNHQGSSFVQTNFFQDVVIASKKIQVRTKNRKFAAPAYRWFDKGPQGMPVVITFKAGKLAVSVGMLNGKKEEMVEVVSTEVKDPPPGKVGFLFSGVSFMISSLRIEGKFPKAWVEKEMAVLKKAGKLVAKLPEKKAPPPLKGSVKRGPDLSKPDPEAEDEL